MNLQQNRYNLLSPTTINNQGTSISTPFYVSPTMDAKKAMLNTFRQIRSKQLLEMGHNPTRKEGQIVVVDNTQPPQTPIEVELGVTEDNLRLLLFSRQGIQERLLVKLQEVTGVHVFDKEEVLETMKLWLDHLIPPTHENKTTPKSSKATTTTTKGRKTRTSSASS